MIRSMLDTDLYKFSMQQAALKLGYANIPVEYEWKCRNLTLDFQKIKPYFEEALNDLFELKFTSDDLDYLESIDHITPDYLMFLKGFKFDKNMLDINYYSFQKPTTIKVKGPFFYATLFEIPLLTILNESWSKLIGGDENYAWSLVEKSTYGTLKQHSSLDYFPVDFYYADFGTRRRRSYEFHDKVLQYHKKNFPTNFIGTSNVHLARKHKIKPIGTQAHEWYQLHQQLDYRLVDFQKAALENWIKVYRGNLGIALSDTINTDAFLKDFDDLYFCKLFDGVREDSEPDPIQFGHKIANFYLYRNINPKTKTIVFSNGITFDKALIIWEQLHNIINVSFGIGEHITNNWGMQKLNMVIKMTKCNGQPVAKISNTPSKGICTDENYIKYLKSIFKVRERK